MNNLVNQISVGQKLFSKKYGEVRVKRVGIANRQEIYPISVVIEPECNIIHYTANGKPLGCLDDAERDLFIKPPEQKFIDVKPGQKLWSDKRGWGEAIKVDDVTHCYPLLIQFANGNVGEYTLDGKYNENHEYPELHWDEIKFEEPEKPKKLITIEKWIGFDRGEHSVILDGHGMQPHLYDSYEDALACSDAQDDITIPKPVKITWQVYK